MENNPIQRNDCNDLSQSSAFFFFVLVFVVIENLLAMDIMDLKSIQLPHGAMAQQAFNGSADFCFLHEVELLMTRFRRSRISLNVAISL